MVTTSLPLLLGTLVTLWLGYDLLPAIVVGSLLASHTMLGSTIVARLGARSLEPMVVTTGATMVSDTLSLLVFAVCVPLYASGFSVSGITIQVVEIVVFVPLVLFGLGRAGEHLLRRVEDEEETYFILMFGILAVTALLAEWINLPGIVGTFLAGLAVNASVKDKPAKHKLEFMGNTLFIPIFFIVTGFMIDPFELIRTISQDFLLAVGIIGALIAGKWIAVGSLWPCLRLRHGGAPDDVVADTATGCGDFGGDTGGLQDFQCRRPAAARCPHAQRGAHHGAGDGRPGAGPDPTLRAAHGGGGEGIRRRWLAGKFPRGIDWVGYEISAKPPATMQRK